MLYVDQGVEPVDLDREPVAHLGGSDPHHGQAEQAQAYAALCCTSHGGLQARAVPLTSLGCRMSTASSP